MSCLRVLRPLHGLGLPPLGAFIKPPALRVVHDFWVFTLRRRLVAIEIVQHSGTACAFDRIEHPPEKPGGFLDQSDAPERIDSKRRIANPGIAIVPVTRATDGLR